MSPEEKIILNKTLELAEENNKMLLSITRSMKIGRIMSVIYWVFIIGSAVGAYYLIQPYIEALTGAYGGVKQGVGGGLNAYLDLFN